MKNLSLIVSIIILLVALSQCSNQPQLAQNEVSDSDYANIVQSIKDYYRNKHSFEAKIEETKTDTTLELTFYAPQNDPERPGEFMTTVMIPLTARQNFYEATPILVGDLSNDNKNDVAVAVHTQGGGTGANISWQDIFVFLADKGGSFKLVTVVSDPDLTNCGGIFRIRKMEKNHLVGIMYCYADDDPRCCPSLKFEAKAALKGNHLSLVSSQKVYD